MTDAAFRADEPGVVGAAVRRIAGVDVEAVAVDAQRRRASAATASTRSRSGRSTPPLVCSTASCRIVSSSCARLGVIQADVRDVVVAELHADGVLHRAAAPTAPSRRWLTFAPLTNAVIGLLELIAVHRVVEEEGEVREQVEVVADAVGGDLGGGVAARPLPLDRAAVAVGVAAVGRIDRAEAADESRRRPRAAAPGRSSSTCRDSPCRSREKPLTRIAAAVADARR